MAIQQRITPCLWYADQAEEAASFYVGIFPNSRITHVTRYGEAGREIHGRPAGSVQAVDFELNGNPFMALNGGPVFTLSEAVSFQVFCDTQEDIDHYWEKLSEGGDPAAQQCGWLKDRFGLSWQIVPTELAELLGSGDSEAGQRVMAAFMPMKKLDIAALRRAHDGAS